MIHYVPTTFSTTFPTTFSVTLCAAILGRGTVGGQKGAPLWMEARGKWMNVNQGHARVPSFKGFGNTAVVLRVPFRKNGGGFALNQYTITMQVRFADLSQYVAAVLLCVLRERDDGSRLVLVRERAAGHYRRFRAAAL